MFYFRVLSMYKFLEFSYNVFYSIELGFRIPLLPRKILYFYSLDFVKLLRLLGGFSVLFYITDCHIYFNSFMQICIISLATTQGLLMLILVIYSTFYSIVLFRELNLCVYEFY